MHIQKSNSDAPGHGPGDPVYPDSDSPLDLHSELPSPHFPSSLHLLLNHSLFLKTHLTTLLISYLRLTQSPLPSENIEALMISMNQVMGCTYCNGLHSELVRLNCGGEELGKLTGVGSLAEGRAVERAAAGPLIGIAYSRIFGETQGLGPLHARAYSELEEEVG